MNLGRSLILCVLITLPLGQSLMLFAQAETQTEKKTERITAYKNIGPEAFDKMRTADTNHVVLDVRTEEEYQQGHIPGAVLLDFSSPDFEKNLSKLDRSKTYLVHCAVGGRSARACKKMDGMNFQKVFNLEGGIQAWEKAGKPVKK